jgi:uncharacterized membrane protein
MKIAPSFLAIELTAFVMAGLLVWHAHRQGPRWLSTILWGMAFGFGTELLLVARAGASYRYGEFLVMLGPSGKQVPLWVGLGWGFILYAATWTAQRLRQPMWLRPLSAGLLAINLDLSLDPVAGCLGWWTWLEPGTPNFYAIPYDNFLGWFFIVASYALFVRLGFRWVPPGVKGSSFWIPPLAALAASLVLFGVRLVSDPVYEALGGPLWPFLLVFGVSSVVAAETAFRSRRDHAKNWTIVAVPVVIHSVLWLILLLTHSYRDPLLSSLLVVIPLNLVVGFFAFAWPSLETLFPVPVPLPAESTSEVRGALEARAVPAVALSAASEGREGVALSE